MAELGASLNELVGKGFIFSLGVNMNLENGMEFGVITPALLAPMILAYVRGKTKRILSFFSLVFFSLFVVRLQNIKLFLFSFTFIMVLFYLLLFLFILFCSFYFIFSMLFFLSPHATCPPVLSKDLFLPLSAL